MNQYFLTCPRGLEEITSNQISKYIKDTPIIDKGGVSFKGDNLDMYMVNLHSRTGMHLLKKVLSFKINSIKELYSKIYDHSWD
jgi:23S rRNA G2445 N2-methylase RlmL